MAGAGRGRLTGRENGRTVGWKERREFHRPSPRPPLSHPATPGSAADPAPIATAMPAVELDLHLPPEAAVRRRRRLMPLTRRVIRPMTCPPVGRAAAPGFAPGRKVRAPRKDGAGQRPARATSGKVPQRTDRPDAGAGSPAFGPQGRGLLRGAIGVRVKRWGKSPPRTRQRGRHGKPHREQDRIGAARARKSSSLFRTSRPGWLREASGNGRPRRMAATWGQPRHTEPGLQADWHFPSPPDHTGSQPSRAAARWMASMKR